MDWYIKMDKIYEDCRYCRKEILRDPIEDRHQGRVSILCPYCLWRCGQWKQTTEEAVHSWNTYKRDDNFMLNARELYSQRIITMREGFV